MKSAYERAMERFGGEPTRLLSDEQKHGIAEIEKRRQARLAEAELGRDRRLPQAASREQYEQILDEYRLETASINSHAERDKELIRQQR